jgi:uncharacterized protein YfaP (DUF2135 family)
MRQLQWSACILCVVLVMFACSKDDEPTTPDTTPTTSTLTDQQKAQISQAYRTIGSSADIALLSTDPHSALQSSLASYQSNPAVEAAWLTDNAMFVNFKNGGTVCWNIASDLVVPPYDGPTAGATESGNCLLKPSELIGNSKALLINTQFGDESRQYNRDLVDYLSQKFQERGFTVTTRNGIAADVAFFKTSLKDFGAIFYISHGTYDGTNTWQHTGEEGSMDSLMSKFPVLWQSKQLAIGGAKETHAGAEKVVWQYMFSQRFIDSMYTGATAFPRSMIYLIACKGMKDAGRQIAQSFFNKGARGIIGWDETNCLGQSTGKQLFTTLLCGANIRDAVGSLPAEARTDKCVVPAGANLVYWPASADTLRLVDSAKATYLVTSPKKDSTYTDRNLTLEGSVLNADTLTTGIVEVNGVATRMTILNDLKSFSQPIVIDSGANYIHLTATGRLVNGRCAYADTVFQVKGNFAAHSLWTELRWNTNNTDVDFHLLPPGASFPGSFWKSTDCCYLYKATSWGGYLDVDDVNGYGPEHITVPAVRDTGTYRLFVHYFNDNTSGTTATTAFVSVSVRGGTIQNFGPYALLNDASSGGDIYEVCSIHVPDGVITPVNALRPAGIIAKPVREPAYKRR